MSAMSLKRPSSLKPVEMHFWFRCYRTPINSNDNLSAATLCGEKETL